MGVSKIGGTQDRKTKNMKGYSRIHGIAFCQDCEWREEDYRICTKKAREHCFQTGHTIDIELGFWRKLKQTEKGNGDD